MRLRPLAVIGSVLCLTAPAAWGDSTEDRVNRAVAKLADGQTEDLVTTLYDDAGLAAACFARRTAALAAEPARLKLVQFAGALEHRAMARAGSRRSTNDEIAAQWVRLLEQDSAEGVREAAAAQLRDLFAPAVLDRYAPGIRGAARTCRNREVLLLYGVLPSNDPQAVRDLARELPDPKDFDSWAMDSLLARYGDEQALSRLLSASESLSDRGLVEVERCFDALAYVPTRDAATALARRLRSEDRVALTGGAAVPRRNLYARALVRMMRDDDGFPVRSEDLFYSDADFDRIESWCSEHLAVEFPATPRPRLTVRPGVESAGTPTP